LLSMLRAVLVVAALLVSAFVVAAAVVRAATQIATALGASRAERARTRVVELLALFAPAIAAAETDVRALLVWQPLARTARALFPEECAALDQASGQVFPFSRARLEAAHAAWTASWLSWERSHDAEYKLKAEAAQYDLAASGGDALARGRLEAIEREKLDLYQRRYEEYIKVAKALHGLANQ
jgi:hypothetical protein